MLAAAPCLRPLGCGGPLACAPQKVTPLISMKSGWPRSISLAYACTSAMFMPLTSVSLCARRQRAPPTTNDVMVKRERRGQQSTAPALLPWTACMPPLCARGTERGASAR